MVPTPRSFPIRQPKALRPTQALTLATAAGLVLLGCGNSKRSERQAPETESLAAPEAPPPSESKTFSVDTGSSDVTFLMEAPVENIRGRAPESVSGSVSFDLADLTKSSGLIKIDLLQLTVYQTKREDADAPWGEETKDEVQNEHMRNWFQISPDAPEEMREANRYIEFRLNRIENPSVSNVMEMTGAERRVTATVRGDFRLHGRTTGKTAQVQLTFVFDGDEPKSVRVSAVDPVPVSLEEHEIQPRETFEKLAQRSLAALGQKVADTAPVTFEFTASI